MAATVDVLIVGAGPAGAVAATELARAGARVRLIDRATFPRDKLCGDTLNPGALARLRTLGMAGGIDALALPIDGMIVSGEGGVSVTARYPRALSGRALVRADLDMILVEQAVKAGAAFDPGITVRHALVASDANGRRVVGVHADRGDFEAPVTIAADGRRSTLAFTLGLARHPARPRRWAIGAYFQDVGGMTRFGEMHVRRARYIGISPVPGGLTNVCLVAEHSAAGVRGSDWTALMREALAAEPLLRERFARARLGRLPVALGPLAVDGAGEPIDGLIVAGDAAGFIDPMTGDGLRFAIQGGELAAHAALDALAHGWTASAGRAGVHAQLAQARRRAFGAKWRFNRALRRLVASPAAMRIAGSSARIAPPLLSAIVAHAGDCSAA
jgi:flavin-dependent dehydrogenase